MTSRALEEETEQSRKMAADEAYKVEMEAKFQEILAQIEAERKETVAQMEAERKETVAQMEAERIKTEIMEAKFRQELAKKDKQIRELKENNLAESTSLG